MSESIQIEEEDAETIGRWGRWNINFGYQNMANEDCDILVTKI